MKDNNEIINKYIDKELSNSEIEILNKLMQEDNNFKRTIVAQKFVHETLYQLSIKKAPSEFTQRVMNKIISQISEKYKKHYFFRFVMSTLTIFLITVLFFFFYFIGELEIVKSAYEFTGNYKSNLIPTFNKISEFVNTDLFKIFTAMGSFILLVGFYFNLKIHNDFKERIKEY